MRSALLPVVGAFTLTIALAVLAVSSERALQNQGARSAASLFARSCASCHGKDGRSNTLKAKFNHARDLTDPQWQASVSDERMANSITNGRGKMPRFGKKMSEAEIDALVSYVRGLKK